MNALKYLGTAALAAYAIFVLAACNGTSNGSSGSSCTYNPNTGTYGDQNGNACNGTSGVGTTTCPATGLNPYTGVTCTPGTVISTTGTTGYTGAPTGYPSTYSGTGSGCQYWTSYYGQQYVPIYYNGQLMCANYYDLIASMSQSYSTSYQSTAYYNDPSYWYQYPPYGGSNYYGSGSAYFSGGYASNFGSGSGFSLNLGIGLSLGF